MTKAKNTAIAYATELGGTACKLLALLAERLDLKPYAMQVPVEPVQPATYLDANQRLDSLARSIRRGLSTAAVTPSTATQTNFDNDLFHAMRLALLSAIQGEGLDFESLRDSLLYWDDRQKWLRVQAGEQRIAADKANRTARELDIAVTELSSVLAMRDLLGAEAVAEAGEAPNKSIAAVSLQMHAEEHGKKIEQHRSEIFAAARGLLHLQRAGIDLADFNRESLEQATAGALLMLTASSPEQSHNVFILEHAVRVRAGVAELLAPMHSSTAGAGLAPFAVIAGTSPETIAAAELALVERQCTGAPAEARPTFEQTLAKLRQRADI